MTSLLRLVIDLLYHYHLIYRLVGYNNHLKWIDPWCDSEEPPCVSMRNEPEKMLGELYRREATWRKGLSKLISCQEALLRGLQVEEVRPAGGEL